MYADIYIYIYIYILQFFKLIVLCSSMHFIILLTSSAQESEESVPALSYKLDHEKLDQRPECEFVVRLKLFNAVF